MRITTQHGLLEIDPEDVISIKPLSLCADYANFDELTYCVRYEDSSSTHARSTACVTERVANVLSRASGVEIQEFEPIEDRYDDKIFVPLAELLLLDKWERHFNSTIAWKRGAESNPEPEHSPSFSDGKTLYEENYQPGSLIDQAFRAQNNCIECGKLVFDVSNLCSGCINTHL